MTVIATGQTVTESNPYTQEYLGWLRETFIAWSDLVVLSFLKVASQFDDLKLDGSDQFIGHEKLSMELAKENRESPIGQLVYDKLLPLFQARHKEGAESIDAKERLAGLRDAMTIALQEKGLLIFLPTFET